MQGVQYGGSAMQRVLRTLATILALGVLAVLGPDGEDAPASIARWIKPTA